jgi:hypothetical protein
VGEQADVNQELHRDSAPSSRGAADHKGNHEYVFVLGKYGFRSPYINQNLDYDARLVLPTDLSSENLRNARPREGPRVKSLIINDATYGHSQGRDNYLKVFCVSK